VNENLKKTFDFERIMGCDLAPHILQDTSVSSISACTPAKCLH
jgi:hypothetical protein